jgi:predicted transposase/invertase (TIGR01784 family)
MPIGISPLVDYAFKMLLGNEQNINLLIHFLNGMLVGQPRIVHARILNPAQLKQTADDKLSILDILAIDELGRHLLIEMQMSLPAGMAQRLTYCVSVSYASQLREGQDYVSLRPSISICVLASAMFSAPPVLHLDFRLREKSSSLILTDDLQIHVLQLKYLPVTADDVYNAPTDQKWSWFLRHADTLSVEDIPRLLPDPEFVEAAKVLNMIAQTPEQLMLYNARLKAQRDESGRILQTKLELEQAKHDVEQAKHEAEQAKHEAEQAKHEVEQAKHEVEQAKHEAEQAKHEAERARLELDRARLQAGQSVAEAEARGMLIGQIVLLRKLLKEPVQSDRELASCDDALLRRIARELQSRLNPGGIST